MMSDLATTYNQMIGEAVRTALDVSVRDINTSIVALLIKRESSIGTVPSTIGVAYCVTNDGLGRWKVVHPYSAFNAIRRNNAPSYLLGEEWQQLESITHMMLSYSDSSLQATGKSGTLEIRRAMCVTKQEYVGQTPHIKNGCVTLSILATGHNVIDSIVYDMQRRKVYFVQTSCTAYSSKTKNIVNFKTDQVKDKKKVLSKKPICKHYTECVSRVQTYYVYATSNMTGWKNHSNVYFLDLLSLLPSAQQHACNR